MGLESRHLVCRGNGKPSYLFERTLDMSDGEEPGVGPIEGGRLFRAMKDGHLNDEHHLAEMASLLGPPPKKFIQRSEMGCQYWDSEGRFPEDGLQPDRCFLKSVVLIDQRQLDRCDASPNQSLESREKQFKGEEKELLLAFVRKIMCWLPEDRPTAEDLFDDSFLTYRGIGRDASPS